MTLTYEALTLKELKSKREQIYTQIKGKPADTEILKELGKIKAEIKRKRPFKK